MVIPDARRLDPGASDGERGPFVGAPEGAGGAVCGKGGSSREDVLCRRGLLMLKGGPRCCGVIAGHSFL